VTVTLKIRGIYATALTKFFTDRGVRVMLPSRVVAERFMGNQNISLDGPVGVEISDMKNRQGILVRGSPDDTKLVVSQIREAFMDAIFRKRLNGQLESMEIEFPYWAKCALDEVRNSVLPTVLNHHRLKTVSPEDVNLMEENILSDHPEKREMIGRDLERRLIWDAYRKGKGMEIDHVKLDGRVLSLSEGEILDLNSRQKTLLLKRSKFKGRSTYDGLNLPKSEGDYAMTEVREGSWHYKHRYYRKDGEPIGAYYNINTPVEFYPDRIRYVDLEIDVVCWPDGSVKIIDEGELNKGLEMGYICEALKERAKAEAHHVVDLESGT